MDNQDLLAINLPKWPQMLVRGKRIEPAQALEIIRRTDTFITHGYYGNDRNWNQHVSGMLGWPDGVVDYSAKVDWTVMETWRDRWGSIYLSYVHNSWLSCSFIGGPHGWCHPDGTIAFTDNIGKWPSVAEVLDDWRTLAREFPFLTLDAVLMSGEGCEENIVPLVGFRVADGEVTLLPGGANDWFEGMDPLPEQDNESDRLLRVFTQSASVREHAIPLSVIEDWVRAQRKAGNETAYPS